MNREHVTVFAPSSVANVGCGYDTIGFAVEALGEELGLLLGDALGDELGEALGLLDGLALGEALGA